MWSLVYFIYIQHQYTLSCNQVNVVTLCFSCILHTYQNSALLIGVLKYILS